MRPYTVTTINECWSNWKLHFWTAPTSSDSHDDDDDDDDDDGEVDSIFNFFLIFIYMAKGYCVWLEKLPCQIIAGQFLCLYILKIAPKNSQ